jgi:hypothetical protein
MMAAVFAALGIYLLVVGIVDVQGEGGTSSPALGLLWLALAAPTLSLVARALASRVELHPREVRLFYLSRSRVLPIVDVIRVVRRRWLGWDILALELTDGRVVRLPLLTQPGQMSRLDDQEQALRRYLAESAESSDPTG